jgi:hypothetical protein
MLKMGTPETLEGKDSQGTVIGSQVGSCRNDLAVLKESYRTSDPVLTNSSSLETRGTHQDCLLPSNHPWAPMDTLGDDGRNRKGREVLHLFLMELWH